MEEERGRDARWPGRGGDGRLAERPVGPFLVDPGSEFEATAGATVLAAAAPTFDANGLVVKARPNIVVLGARVAALTAFVVGPAVFFRKEETNAIRHEGRLSPQNATSLPTRPPRTPPTTHFAHNRPH